MHSVERRSDVAFYVNGITPELRCAFLPEERNPRARIVYACLSDCDFARKQ